MPPTVWFPAVKLTRLWTRPGRRWLRYSKSLPYSKTITQLPLLLPTLIFSIFSQITDVSAQPLPTQPSKSRFGVTNGSINQANTFSVTDSLNNILEASSNTSTYNPLMIRSLRRLKDQSAPYWSGDRDSDNTRTRRIVEKAFALESARNLNALIRGSELNELYRGIKQGLSELQQVFRYSLQDTHSGLTVSKKQVGKRLLELRVEFNASQGVDPQIAIGEYMRFRYNYVEQKPMLEVGFDF